MTSKVYTVNGPAAGSSSSLPDWLTRKRAQSNGKTRRHALSEQVSTTIELIQGFEFPEASLRVKTTRDGTHAVATGTYKPQIKVFDLSQLSLKFERHTDAENVDFELLSDDWTKSIHLQNDRTLELHTQGGFHYRTRIPRFGRALKYHFQSCDTYVAASGNEVYRLNLELGRFMTPVLVPGDGVDGVNTLDINPAHGLLAFGTEGNGTVVFVDPRSRASVGALQLPSTDACAIASRSDGLSYAVGTNAGQTLLYDIRSRRPFAVKEQGYGLPVKNLTWVDAPDPLVISADRKVVKIWGRSDPSRNQTSLTPPSDINHVHHVPHSGLLLVATEAISLGSYYIPSLGPAPKWASFLEGITEEMEVDEKEGAKGVYEDYKFLSREDIASLGLTHLTGTPALKPYMHGYFISLKLYDAARVIANPYVYEEQRAKIVQAKMDKAAEGRIRTVKGVNESEKVKVNRALADKIARDEEKEARREERRVARRNAAAMDVDGTPARAGGEDEEVEVGEEEEEPQPKKSLLTDPRFSKLFEDAKFAVDEDSREYALMNPSQAFGRRNANGGAKTAVEEEEEEEGDKNSGSGSDDSDSDSEKGRDSDSDSSDAGELNTFDPRARPGQTNPRAQEAYKRTKEQNRQRNADVNWVPVRAQPGGRGGGGAAADRTATFGQRKRGGTGANDVPVGRGAKASASSTNNNNNGKSMEVSWVPSASAVRGEDDDLVEGSGRKNANTKTKSKRRGVEEFGAGMEKGGEDPRLEGGSGSERMGRTERRKGGRSGSRNVFRKMDG